MITYNIFCQKKCKNKSNTAEPLHTTTCRSKHSLTYCMDFILKRLVWTLKCTTVEFKICPNIYM